MEITSKEKSEILTIISNYFEGIGEIETIKEIKIYQSESSINVSIYPESSISLSFYDLKNIFDKLEGNNYNFINSIDLLVINFDPSDRCVTISFSHDPE